MPMPSYRIICTHPGCESAATYKIAARWSDGVTQELKTYALCCEEHLAEVFRQSRQKHAVCRRAKDEILDAPGIFRLKHGERDRRLQRLEDREKQLQPV
jgi:hypothetical protein